MRIVIDTNVVISGTFFGGKPGRVIEAVDRKEVTAFATPAIIQEYKEIVEEMIAAKQGTLRTILWQKFFADLELIEETTTVSASRDPDDDKFISCAIDAEALFVVSGDDDLLSVGAYKGIEIITAAAFCDRYLEEREKT